MKNIRAKGQQVEYENQKKEKTVMKRLDLTKIIAFEGWKSGKIESKVYCYIIKFCLFKLY